MKEEHVHVEKLRRQGGDGLRITIPDDDTDTLVVIEILHRKYERPHQIGVSTMIRGNYCGSTRYGASASIVRRPVRTYLTCEAPRISETEMQRRKDAARKLVEADQEPTIML